jgi:hypothetical protein
MFKQGEIVHLKLTGTPAMVIGEHAGLNGCVDCYDLRLPDFKFVQGVRAFELQDPALDYETLKATIFSILGSLDSVQALTTEQIAAEIAQGLVG